MSTWYREELSCSICEHRFPGKLLYGMHVSNLPEARAQILDGSFQLFTCPECGHVFRIERRAVYTDFDRGHYLAIEPGNREATAKAVAEQEAVFSEAFTYGPEVAAKLGDALIRRVVFGFDAAREKLLLWDAGIDDRAFEAAKLDAMKAAGLTSARNTRSPCVLRLEKLMDRGHILCRRVEATWRVLSRRGTHTAVVAMPRTLGFNTIPAAMLAARVDAPDSIVRDYPWLGHGWLVDGVLGARA